MKIPLSWQRFIPANWRGKGHRLLRDVIAMFSALRNPRVPLAAKALTMASVAYFILPFDIIPDVIPVIGLADDLAFIPIACHFASKMVPTGVMERLRDDAEYTLLRWGPKFRMMIIVFVAMWLLLGGIGGCLFLRKGGQEERAGRVGESIDWEMRMTRDAMRHASE